MNKFINRYKLLIAVIAVMAFLPLPNLYAYDWDTYYSCTEYESADYVYYDPDHYYKEVDTDADFSDVNDASGIDVSCFVYVYTWADVWTDEEEYSNSFYLHGEAEIECGRDYEWDGPPATAPGADIGGNLEADAYQYVYGVRYPSQITADTDASSYTGGWAEAVAYDSSGSDMCTVGMDSEGYVDSYDSDVDYSILSNPDDYDWYPDNDDFTYEGTLGWTYDSSFDYDVSSGLAWFSVEAFFYGCASSDVYIDADETGFLEETYAISEVYVSASSSISVE